MALPIDPALAVAGACTGLVVGLTGVGGGALMTPILLLFFGVPPVTAVATDLWFAAVTKLVAVPLHQRGGQVDWQVVRRLWFGSLPVALAVVAVVAMGGQVERMAWLTRAIGVVVLITAIGLVIGPRLASWAKSRRIGDPERFKARQPMLTVMAGGMLGVLVALTSVGAGALGTVLMVALYPLRMTPHRLVATDLVHAIPLAMIAGSGYLLSGLVDGAMLGSMLVGSVPAVVVGSQLACWSSPARLRVALAAVLLLAGLRTLV
jgi:uncharacterized membrane protein YfcA